MKKAETLALLIKKKYTVKNVRRQRQITTYVQNVIRRCKNAEIDIVFQQLNWVWNHLNSDLQRDIIRSIIFTTIFSFIKQMKNIQNVWKRYYVKETSSKKQWQFFQAAPQSYNDFSVNQNYYSRDQQYSNDEKRYVDNSNSSYSQKKRNNQQWNSNNQRSDQNHNYQRNDQKYNNQFRYSVNSSSVNKQRLIETSSKQASWQKFV